MQGETAQENNALCASLQLGVKMYKQNTKMQQTFKAYPGHPG